ncbi:outer membrane lipid asymmetry maintenance protein MlaD [Phaeovibrio sulfidiphilus]|uniref:Outer membrane lipid asymmetry maintenance protein MlaD n=1 Tax=Phaeovibrio sulfidiphilus TaxID=1220600 RepID=A0A8J6YWY9_9PROT|nr:outer membrane lipid asymmetry maintenance protein MlaD [Phaeovibrio sulfidiphilus]MBE1237182.1 outer membrane lipid asymmetry maintenance protein MlaD [Phaeovibrio sulfidiphilus]
MKRNPVETLMGAVVLVTAALFLGFAYTSADFRPTGKAYPLTAVFQKVGGLEVGADVRLNGVKIGTVSGLALDESSYEVQTTLSIAPDVHIPDDTQASIVNDGFLGGQYVRLEPGHSSTTLESGATLHNTRNFTSIEDMVGEIIFLATQP